MNVLPLPGTLVSRSLAAEQVRQLAADRETEAGAAVLARRAGVGLLERLEDDPLLLRRDADAGVGDGELDDRRRLAEDRVIRRSSRLSRRPTCSRTLPCAVNLKAFDSRFLRICSRRFESVVMWRPTFGVEVRDERQRARFRLVAEVALDRLAQVREQQVLGLDRDRAGFDLRQVEDVADQVQQVGARAVDGLGELDLARRSGCCRRSRPAAGRGSGCC